MNEAQQQAEFDEVILSLDADAATAQALPAFDERKRGALDRVEARAMAANVRQVFGLWE